MANYRQTFAIHGGIWDGVPVNQVPDNAVSWARQADFGYPAELRVSAGMTRHVTDDDNLFVLGTGSDRVRNIFDVQIEGTNYLLCIKADGSTADRIWDITDGTTVSSITQLVRPGSSDRLYNQPYSVAQWDDEVFIVSGESPIDAGALYNYGLCLSRSGGAWTASTIGVAYASGETTAAPTVAATAGTVLYENSQYGFRVLGYDTSQGTYADIASVGGVDQEIWLQVGSAATAGFLTVATSATTLGVDALRVFRTLRNGSEFFYEGSLTGTDTEFTTTMTDGELQQQALYMPGGVPPDTFYLITRHNERLVAIGSSNDDRLYYSQVSRPHEWHVENYRELPNLGRPVGLSSRAQVITVHYDTGLIVTLVGHDAETAQITQDCKETFGAVNNASIVESTYKSYFMGAEGVMVYTGQACPQKISYAVDGTWSGLTRANMAEASAIMNDRGRAREFWLLVPQDNLLFKLPVESAQPGTRIGIDRCHGTALGRQRDGTTTNIYLGTNEGAVFQLDTGAAYGTSTQLLSTTVTGGSTTEIVVSGAATTSFGHLGMPFTITSGGAEGASGWITDYSSASTLSVTPSLTVAADINSRVVVGALPFDIYTKWFDMGRPKTWKRWNAVGLNITEDTNASARSGILTVYAAVQDDLAASPRSTQLDWEIVGEVDFGRVESPRMAIDRVGCYLALRFVTYDYQVARTMQSIDLEYEYLRTGPS